MRKSCKGLSDYMAVTYHCAAEIGVGHFPDVGLNLLKKGLRVFATDVKPFLYDGLDVFVDDVTHPDLSLFTGVEIVYSVRPPLELVPYMERLSKQVLADLAVKPLYSEYPGWQLTGTGKVAFFLWRRP